MERNTEVQQIVYDILLTQIESGTYHYMESLPTIETVSKQFHVSIDTTRAAYNRLKKEGYISLSKNIGAKVIVEHNKQEIAQHIHSYFALRKDALIDLSKSLRLLFGHTQWISIKHASPKTLEHLNDLSHLSDKRQMPYEIWQCLEDMYSSLGNELFTRLSWSIYMFFYAPFFSIAGNSELLDRYKSHTQDIVTFCHEGDWLVLHEMIDRFLDDLSVTLCQFYENKIVIESTEQKVSFCWDSYRKPSQLCYSLAMDLLIEISRGVYSAGNFLPSIERLSVERNVSVSTVRRALRLLGSIGAVKPSRPFGTRILSLNQYTQNCDFSQPVLQRRLLDMTESLQIFALTSKAVSECTLASLSSDSLRQWRQELISAKKRQRYEVLNYTVLDLLSRFVPYQTIRTVYSELLRQFFWAHALRGVRETQETLNAIYGPYFDTLIQCLEAPDIPLFSTKLEELITYELHEMVSYLRQLKISGTEHILIPDAGDFSFLK